LVVALNFSCSTRTEAVQRLNPSLLNSDSRQKSFGGGLICPRAHSMTCPFLSANVSSARHHLRRMSRSITMVWSVW